VTTRCAIYARVSTSEQEPRTQLRELATYAKRRRFTVTHTLVEKESGADPTRPKLRELMAIAGKRQVDVVLVWKFDRFARSTQQLLAALEEFRQLGIDFISYTENVDTSTPSGKALFGMVSVIAEFERDLIRERIRAGVARARADGTRLGRPTVPTELVTRIRALHRQGKSRRVIARETGAARSTVLKYAPNRRPISRAPRLRSTPRSSRRRAAR
jgi:DNA invertase Pin-like site-specific DNA recombinase